MLSALFVLVGSTTPTNNDNPGGQGQEFGSASPVALVVIILLFIAAAVLVWSMTRHLKKVPKSFDPEELAAIEAEEKAAAEQQDEPATKDSAKDSAKG